jgi:cell volume regulation protein A
VDAAVLTLVLVFVIRPVFTYPVLRGFRRTPLEATFATVGGLKGAVPILLAALPLEARLDGSERIFALAGLVVLASLALQGPVVARLAPRVAEG